jgi:RimJ/RimL family protein N-acetyltransferase
MGRPMRPPPGPSRLTRVELPILTSRMALRPPQLRDVPGLVPLVSDWRVARPTRIPHPYGSADGIKFVRKSQTGRRNGTDFALLLTSTSDGRILGGIGLHRIDWANRRAELGYWISPSEWGHGLAPEAAYALCRIGFEALRLHRIYATVLAFNPRSARVLRKVGFRLEGRAREDHRDGRRYVDALRFGLLRQELRRPS